MIDEQSEETDADAVELRHMAEEERRELVAGIAELEAHVTVRLSMSTSNVDDIKD